MNIIYDLTFLIFCCMYIFLFLYFEVPLVMLPQTSEQKGVAERVYQLGAGIKIDKLDGDSVLSAINKILGDSTYKQNAKKIAESFKNSSGAKGAADKIIQVCNDALNLNLEK